MISGILNDIATGSAAATPSFGSATLDYAADFPAAAIRFFSGLIETIGS